MSIEDGLSILQEKYHPGKMLLQRLEALLAESGPQTLDNASEKLSADASSLERAIMRAGNIASVCLELKKGVRDFFPNLNRKRLIYFINQDVNLGFLIADELIHSKNYRQLAGAHRAMISRNLENCKVPSKTRLIIRLHYPDVIKLLDNKPHATQSLHYHKEMAKAGLMTDCELNKEGIRIFDTIRDKLKKLESADIKYTQQIIVRHYT